MPADMSQPDPFPEHDVDADHMVETPETLQDADPEAPPMDRGTEASDRPLAAEKHGTTHAETAEGQTLDDRLAEEEPDIAQPDPESFDPGTQAGRLVEPDQGAGTDTEKDAVAAERGGRSAEEAAVRVEEER